MIFVDFSLLNKHKIIKKFVTFLIFETFSKCYELSNNFIVYSGDQNL